MEILIKYYTYCSVFFRPSFDGKNVNVNKICYAKMRDGVADESKAATISKVLTSQKSESSIRIPF